MKTKKMRYAPTYWSVTGALLLLAGIAPLQAQSFADWTGLTDGASSGSANWDGYGTVNYSISYIGNSDGIHRPQGGTQGVNATPTATHTNTGDLDPWGVNDPEANNWLRFVAGSNTGQADKNVGYQLKFTFDGGDTNIFPANDPVFYLSDVDYGDFIISAKLDGINVNVSDWYYGARQTASENWVSVNGNDQNWPGEISTWNPSTGSLEGAGQSSLWVHSFKPTSEFDEITFTYVNGNRNDVIFFAIGDVAIPPVPEPSGAALLGAAGMLALLRRRRR